MNLLITICRLSQIPQSYFFSLFCLHPAYPVFTLSVLCVCLSFHHDDYAITLLCLHLSTYSATSSSSLRNFLTLKFPSEEFIKIAYSPPSSRHNALSPAPSGTRGPSGRTGAGRVRGSMGAGGGHAGRGGRDTCVRNSRSRRRPRSGVAQ